MGGTGRRGPDSGRGRKGRDSGRGSKGRGISLLQADLCPSRFQFCN